MLDENGAPVGKVGHIPLLASNPVKKFVDIAIELPAAMTQFDQFTAGHAEPKVGKRQVIKLQIAVVAKYKVLFRIGHSDAKVHTIQRGIDECGVVPAGAFRAL